MNRTYDATRQSQKMPTPQTVNERRVTSKIQRLPSELFVSAKYQRPVNPKRVQAIVDHFDPNKVNIIKVSYRDGQYYVIDGAHTLEALKKLHKGHEFNAVCRVYHGLTYQEEADLFASQYDNSSHVPFKYELKARLISEDGDYEKFRILTEEVGLQLATEGRGASHTINAMEKAWGIYRKYGADFYARMLDTLVKTWHGDAWSLQAPMLGGMAVLMSKFPHINLSRFVKKLSIADVNAIKREASGITRSKDVAYALAMARIFNTNGGRFTINADLLLV